MGARRVPLSERLIRDTTRVGDCLIWTGQSRKGYPATNMGNKTLIVTRLVLEEVVGRPLLTSEQACHTCDTPLCVNRDHLFVGSNRENKDDCVRKARQAKGTRIGLARLDEAKVQAIRASKAGSSVLAAEYGVCRSAIKRARNGTTWSHT